MSLRKECRNVHCYKYLPHPLLPVRKNAAQPATAASKQGGWTLRILVKWWCIMSGSLLINSQWMLWARTWIKLVARLQNLEWQRSILFVTTRAAANAFLPSPTHRSPQWHQQEAPASKHRCFSSSSPLSFTRASCTVIHWIVNRIHLFPVVFTYFRSMLFVILSPS